jgi:hypothetical protein
LFLLLPRNCSLRVGCQRFLGHIPDQELVGGGDSSPVGFRMHRASSSPNILAIKIRDSGGMRAFFYLFLLEGRRITSTFP